MAEYPLVSVIIPTYNREKSIKRAVESVLNQTYKNLEVIVVDDGSEDNTEKVVSDIKDDRIMYTWKENGGPCSARNVGIGLAEGTWIAFQDSDDAWKPDKLQKQMDMILENGYDVVFCKLDIERNGERILLPKRIRGGRVTLNQDFYGVGTQSLVIRKNVLLDEPLDIDIPRYEDTEWIYRILCKGYKVCCINEGLVDYEINEDSLSVNWDKMYKALAVITEKHPDLRMRSPVIAMHAAKDAFSGFMNHIRKAEYSGSGKYIPIIARLYPGLVKYLIRRRRGRKEGPI